MNNILHSFFSADTLKNVMADWPIKLAAGTGLAAMADAMMCRKPRKNRKRLTCGQ